MGRLGRVVLSLKEYSLNKMKAQVCSGFQFMHLSISPSLGLDGESESGESVACTKIYW